MKIRLKIEPDRLKDAQAMWEKEATKRVKELFTPTTAPNIEDILHPNQIELSELFNN